MRRLRRWNNEICGVWLLLFAASSLGARQVGNYRITNDASTRVESFKADNVSLLDALLQFGRQQRLPMGIEYLDIRATDQPISVDVGPATVGKVLDTILRHEPGYSWSIQNGILHITNVGALRGRMNLLDRVLSEFSVPKDTLTDADYLLKMTLYVELHPKVQGFGGDIPGEISRTQVGPFKLTHVTVREALDEIVREAGDAAWVVQVPPESLDHVPSYGLWRVIEYQPGMPKYGPLVSELLRRHPQ